MALATAHRLFVRQSAALNTEATTTNSTKHRNVRLELRLTPKAKAMLKRAADIERKSLIAFLIDKGLEAAAETLAERNEFSLSAKQYGAFAAAFDSPVKLRPRLERLLAKPSILA